MKGYWSRVNLVKHEALLKDLHATSVLSFPNVNNNVYFNPYIHAKAAITLKVEKKINVSFLSCDRCLSLENICHGFLMLHRRRMTSE